MSRFPKLLLFKPLLWAVEFTRTQGRDLSLNRPTPDPSQEGSRHWSASCQFPSWEGLGVGSWSQCMRKKRKRAFKEEMVGEGYQGGG